LLPRIVLRSSVGCETSSFIISDSLDFGIL
jgi:hypothetical protein